MSAGGGCGYTNVVWGRLNLQHQSYSNFVCHGESMNFDATPLIWRLTKSHSNRMPSLSMSWDPFHTVWHGCGQWVRRNTSKCKTCKKQDISCCDFHYAPRDFSVWLVTIHLGSDFWENRSKGNLWAAFQVVLLSHFATPFFKYSRIRKFSPLSNSLPSFETFWAC